jgi:fibronectin-binding autotransporter adhesin
MNRQFRAARWLLTATLLCMGHALAAGVQYQTVRAATANDVINEMLIAGRSGQPTIIRLAAGHYLFSRAFNSPYDPSLLPVVATTIQIVASNPATTSFELDPNASFPYRFFTVIRGGNLSVYKLTLRGGAEECVDNCAKLGGGAALNAGGELDFVDCVLTQNAAFNQQGLGIGGGGAILNLAGHFLLNRSTVTGNVAVSIGGAVALLGGKGSIWNSTISGNGVGFGFGDMTFAFGAGIFVAADANLFITGSTISGNTMDGTGDESRAFGVGIYSTGTTSVVNSAVVENILTARGQGDTVLTAGSGGGIYNGGTMSIENSTIGGNSVGTLGGGIYNGGRLQLQGATITGNLVYGAHGFNDPGTGFPDGCTDTTRQLCVSGGSGIWNEPSGTVTLAQSAIGANDGEDCHGVLTSKGHNAIGDSLNCTLTASAWLGGRPTHDLVNLDIRLGDLQDDGVPGNAHYAPLAGSPLIDAGGSIGLTCSQLDQIGQRRVDGDADHDGANVCDVGAIEFQPPSNH